MASMHSPGIRLDRDHRGVRVFLIAPSGGAAEEQSAARAGHRRYRERLAAEFDHAGRPSVRPVGVRA